MQNDVVPAVVSVGAGVQCEMSPLLSERMPRQAPSDILGVAGTGDLEAYDTSTLHGGLEQAGLNGQSRPVTAVECPSRALGAGFAVAGVATRSRT